MTKRLTRKEFKLGNFLTKINNQFETYKLQIIILIVILSFVNLILAASIIVKVFPNQNQQVIGEVQSANLPVLKILEPAQGSTVSGEFRVVLAFNHNSVGFAKVTVLVDGMLEKEIELGNCSQLSLNIDSTKFGKGAHKLLLKVTDTLGRTQTAQLDLTFTKKTSFDKAS